METHVGALETTQEDEDSSLMCPACCCCAYAPYPPSLPDDWPTSELRVHEFDLAS